MRLLPSTAFGRLWSAALASNLADGIARLAIPLVAVSLTTDPLVISLIAALSYLPWLLFSVPAGMLVDRYDRRYVMALANLVRTVVAGGVALSIATGQVTVTVLLVATIVFGAAETMFDNATNAVLPATVTRDRLDRANGRVNAAQVGVDMFVAQPVSGVLFAMAMVLPVIVSGAGYAIAALLVMALPVTVAHARRDGADASTSSVPLRTAMSFLWNHRFLRSMTLVTTAVGTFLAFAQAVTVLLFIERFGVTEALVGLVTAGIGVGGLTGSLVAARWVARWGRGRVLWAATMVGAVGLVVVGLTSHVVVAVMAYAVSAMGISTWNVAWAALRQMIVPDHLMGRVIGAARTLAWGLMPVATVVGGIVARVDLQLPTVIGGAAALVVGLVCARLLLSADGHEPPGQAPATEWSESDRQSTPDAVTAPVPGVGTVVESGPDVHIGDGTAGNS